MSDDCCGKGVDVGALEAQQQRVLKTVLVINLVAFAMMVTGWTLSGSSSLLSGTLDNLGDALTYAMSLAVVGATTAAKAKVALFKGVLILFAAVAVAAQIVWHLANPHVPLVESMSVAATLNLAANLFCLWLLTPHRDNDVNMQSVWECSRNDIFDGVAVLAATAAVWLTESHWPDILIAAGLLILFCRSAVRVLRNAWLELFPSAA